MFKKSVSPSEKFCQLNCQTLLIHTFVKNFLNSHAEVLIVRSQCELSNVIRNRKEISEYA